jgi:hypothetical protein
MTWHTILSLVAQLAALTILNGCVPNAVRPTRIPRTSQLSGESREPSDSVRATAVRMYELVQMTDRYARSRGELPQTLVSVLQRSDQAARDLWNHEIVYGPQGERYELRSAGHDGILNDSDDVVVLAQLGRDRPCETRFEHNIVVRDSIAPKCSGTDVVTILPLCPALASLRVIVSDAPVTGEDSVLSAGKRLVRLARRIDGVGRNMGGLPPTLRGVVSPQQQIDLWGRMPRYATQGEAFEVRSAGIDGKWDNADDLVVSAHLGHSIRCEFLYGSALRKCDEPSPNCPYVDVAM